VKKLFAKHFSFGFMTSAAFGQSTILSEHELKSSYCPNSVDSLHITYKNEHKKGQFELAGIGKLIEKQFSIAPFN
jgi:hypothetical protein